PPHPRTGDQGRAHRGRLGRSLPGLRSVQGDPGSAVLLAAAGLAVASPPVRSPVRVSATPGTQGRFMARLLPERGIARRRAFFAPAPVPADDADPGLDRKSVV